MSELSKQIEEHRKKKEEFDVKEDLLLKEALQSSDVNAIIKAQNYW